MLIVCYLFSGIFAISVALLCDGYIGNLQELAMKKYQIPGLQIVSANQYHQRRTLRLLKKCFLKMQDEPGNVLFSAAQGFGYL